MSVDSEPRTLPCENKAKYDNRKKAAQAASRLRLVIINRTGGISEPIEPYHCDPHHAWHVGHKKGWRHEVGSPRPVIRTL